MHDLFNPAGLGMLEDREGAIAYGCVAPRVFYARFVGQLSTELGTNFVHQLEAAVGEAPALAYFADASALTEHDVAAQWRFARFVAKCRVKFASLAVLTRARVVNPLAPALAGSCGGRVQVLTDPLEFERALANVALLPERSVTELPQVWQAHAPG